MEASIRDNGAKAEDLKGYWYSAHAKWTTGETWSMDGDEVVHGGWKCIDRSFRMRMSMD